MKDSKQTWQSMRPDPNQQNWPASKDDAAKFKQMSELGKVFQGFGEGVGTVTKEFATSTAERVGDVIEAFTPEEPSAIVPPPISPAEMVDLLNPSYEGQIKGIEISSMLASLMATDEVLAEADEELLATYYNQIAKLAPRAAREPLVVGPMLRKMLYNNGQLDPIEVKALADLENALKKRDEADPTSMVT